LAVALFAHFDHLSWIPLMTGEPRVSHLNQDAEQLKLLSIFHYVVGGLAGLVSLLPSLHLFIGIMMVTGRFEQNGRDEARLFGWFLIIFAALAILVGFSCAIAIALTGRFLGRRLYYTFCLVMAAVECLFVPIGTVLGVFTILVLQRPTVRAMFGRPPS
jgi:hypothetical protein